ncbi:hypothetical protein [Sphingomonas morindae]|uniref:Uncharacterized protein n=1 Tax=Sphingomonas morindae TaxID=1541170 RepID=A0ABY4X9Z8_9SPHN|nr:hypothetical protein [Sphingomonas morindae]USI73566.1 hypothetical protein LHA26_03535 [Sphingomonas morindae]
MTVATDLLPALQWHQLIHDEDYHKDVAAMSPAMRMKHFALHLAKYSAYLLDASERGDDALTARALVDSFAIVLAIANTLGQNLACDLPARNQEDLAGQSPDVWRSFVKEAGILAKACESLDHIEDLAFKVMMKQANARLAVTILRGADQQSIGLIEAYKVRLREVEIRSPFDAFIQQRRSGRTQ